MEENTVMNEVLENTEEVVEKKGFDPKVGLVVGGIMAAGAAVGVVATKVVPKVINWGKGLFKKKTTEAEETETEVEETVEETETEEKPKTKKKK